MSLSVEEFRGRVTSKLDDGTLQLLLDAADQAIRARFGEPGGTYGLEEVLDGGQSYVFLRRGAASINAITETVGTTETVLDETDYRLRGDGVSLLRLATGAHPRGVWGAPVVVSYAPLDDADERDRVQAALVQLDLNYVPGNITAETIGSWSESRSANGVFDYATEREKILDSLLYVTAPGFA